MPLILYHTPHCSYTPALAQVIKYLNAPCAIEKITALELANFPGAVYRDGPILKTPASGVEDWRAIVRYLDEECGNGALTRLAPERQVLLFDLCEEIDRELIYPASQIFNPVANSALKTLLRWTGVTSAKFLGSKDALLSRIDVFRNDARLQKPDFLLARLLVDGIQEWTLNF